MPKYEKYEDESQEAADVRIAKNKELDSMSMEEEQQPMESMQPMSEDSSKKIPSDRFAKDFEFILSNMSQESEMSEIIGFDDGRDQVGLYAVRTDDGIKFVHGLTDRYNGYGETGNPNYETSADAKYGSAKNKSDNGDYLSYEEAYNIYKREAKRREPGMADKVIKSLSNYMGGDE